MYFKGRQGSLVDVIFCISPIKGELCMTVL